MQNVVIISTRNLNDLPFFHQCQALRHEADPGLLNNKLPQGGGGAKYHLSSLKLPKLVLVEMTPAGMDQLVREGTGFSNFLLGLPSLYSRYFKIVMRETSTSRTG